MTIHFEPLGDEEPISEEEFAAEVRELVDEDAPRVFALVEEHGERDDAWVYAWGMAFDDHVEVITADRSLRRTFNSVEHAQRKCSLFRNIRLVWPNPTPPNAQRRTGEAHSRELDETDLNPRTHNVGDVEFTDSADHA